MKKFNRRFTVSPLSVSLLLFVFASCATAPRVSAPAPDQMPPVLSLLPAGGSVYLWADAAASRPLLDVISFGGFSAADAATVIDRTDNAAAVVFPAGQDRRFFLAAAGRYPRHRANYGFAFSRQWRRQRGLDRRTFWYSRNNNIAVAMGPRLALVSNIDPFENFETEIPPPDFDAFRQGMALAGWIPNPSESINDFLEVLGVPIQLPAEEFFFGAIRSPVIGYMEGDAAPWDLVFRVGAPSEMHARSLLALFSMARVVVMQGMGLGGTRFHTEEGSLSLPEIAMLLFANVPEQDGAFLTFRIDAFDQHRIALLFHVFSVYSNH